MDPACPCINAAPLFVEANLTLTSRQTVRYNCSAGSIFDVGGRYGCLPPDYGSLSCQKWDEPLLSCTEDPAAWCQMPWCYVDRDACMRSDLDVQGSLMFPALQRRLFYSYGTCDQSGDPLAFASTINDFTQELAGETLQVGIPTMDFPLHFKRDGDGNVVTGIGELFFDNSVPWEGSMIQYMDAILALSNFESFKYTFASNNARLVKPSSKWTAVVYDVSNHALDFGGSDFWLTTERSAMSAFSASYDIDLHYLWVPRPKVDNSFMKVATKVFIPFSPSLWFLLFVVTMLVSLVQVYIFRDDWRNDGHDEWKNAKGLLDKVKVVVFCWCSYLGKALIHITAGVDSTGSCEAQTIMYAGWSFFILIVISAYTANLAAYMLRDEAGTYIVSMEAAVLQRSVVCVAMAVKAELQVHHPPTPRRPRRPRLQPACAARAGRAACAARTTRAALRSPPPTPSAPPVPSAPHAPPPSRGTQLGSLGRRDIQTLGFRASRSLTTSLRNISATGVMRWCGRCPWSSVALILPASCATWTSQPWTLFWSWRGRFPPLSGLRRPYPTGWSRRAQRR